MQGQGQGQPSQSKGESNGEGGCANMMLNYYITKSKSVLKLQNTMMIFYSHNIILNHKFKKHGIMFN